MIIIPALLLSFFTTQASFVDFAIEKWRKDPEVRIEDAYKWVYQATRGSEHAVTDEIMVRDYLQQEWKTLGRPLAGEPLWEPLRRDGKLGRLNLRQFHARGGRMEDLANAFIESAKEFRGDESDFLEAWNALGMKLARKHLGRLTWAEWHRLDQAMSAQNYPAIHHSDAYTKARRPAYRVLTRQAFERLFKTLKQPSVARSVSVARPTGGPARAARVGWPIGRASHHAKGVTT